MDNNPETLPQDGPATPSPTTNNNRHGPRARGVCITINNYTDGEQEDLRALCASASYAVFGRETGESGTPHLQGYIHFKQPRALSALKKVLPRAHLEIARGTPEDNRRYCTKDNDFEEFGELPKQGKRNEIAALREAIKAGERNPKRLRDQYDAACRHPHLMRQLLIDNMPKPATPSIVLRPWQAQVIELVRGPPEDRKIHFYVDSTGNAGKSTFATYLESLFDDVQVIKPGRYPDMAFELIDSTRILIMDCPRSRTELIQYNFLEDVKDGRVTNSKYESYQKRLGPCHVLVFMNEYPDSTKLSVDRVKVHEVSA